MRRLKVLTLLSVCAIASFWLVSLAGGETAPFDRISNRGVVTPPHPKDAQIFQRFGSGRVSAETTLLASRNGRNFYRVGPDCFGTGPANVGEYRFGHVACTEDFPSKEHPLLDFASMKGKLVDGKMTDVSIYRSEGIAADGVASVAFRRSDGELAGETPVAGNTYKHTAIPPGTLTELVALDESGAVVGAHVFHSVPR